VGTLAAVGATDGFVPAGRAAGDKCAAEEVHILAVNNLELLGVR
jgi:hypothetical protein